MARIIIAAVAVTALLVSAKAIIVASPYCLPKADGTDRIIKTGSVCPTGYFSTGNCCEAFHRDAPRAIPKIKGAACPTGYFASGESCKAFR